MMLFPPFLAICLLLMATLIQAHTWIEMLQVIATNGTFVGLPGYSRAFQARSAGSDPDFAMTNLIPPNGRSTGNAVLSTDLMCKYSQTIGNQTSGSPSLTASAGDMVALRYQENGHITQPQIPAGKPMGSGHVTVYGTSQPSNNDTFMEIHKVWNAEGTGGDGRGKLLATRYFDDGQCYQINTSPISLQRQQLYPHIANSLMGQDLWCQTDIQLPANITDSYTLYWVWDWPTMAGTEGFPDGKNESYTTCMDITIANNGSAQLPRNAKEPAADYVVGQAIDYAAISAQVATPYLLNPTAAFINFTSSVVPPVTSFVPSATGAANATGSFHPATTSATSQPSVSISGNMPTITVTATVTPVPSTIYVTVNDGTTLAPGITGSVSVSVNVNGVYAATGPAALNISGRRVRI